MDKLTRLRAWSLCGRLGLAVGLAVGVVLTTASPASAHGLGGLQPTNFRSRVTHITPAVSGLSVRSVDLGTRIELTNRTRRDVVVLGYGGEPYLRVGPRGVFENRRSPAVYLNKTTRGTTSVPAFADTKAKPQWRRTGDGPTARWHDHRAHWMGLDDPPQVRRDPGSPHLVQPFEITLVRAGTRIHVVGDVRWVPGPSPWLWLAVALLLAVAIIALARARSWTMGLALALALLAAAQIVHVIGLWGGATGSSWAHLVMSAYSLGGIALALIALVVLSRKGRDAAAPLALLAGLFLFLAGGLADVTTLSRSQVPTTLSLWSDRLAVAVTLGSGVATAVIAAMLLRAEALRRRRAAWVSRSSG